MKCSKCNGYMIGTGEKGSEYQLNGTWGVFYRDVWKCKKCGYKEEI